MLKTIPEPTYEYETGLLIRYYTRAMRDLDSVLKSLDLTKTQRAFQLATMGEIQRVLTDLNAQTAEWAKEYVPLATRDGVVRTLVALDLVENAAEAQRIYTFSSMNEHLVATAVADLQDDLLAVTQNIERRVRTGLRQATQEAMRSNMTAGLNNNRDLSRDILAQARQRLGQTLETGIIDSVGRRWKPEVYTNMVARTKLTSTHLEATQNEAIERGAYYGIISSHGAKDYCRFHEGRIVKLTPEAPGDYPTVEELKATGQIFHPRCKHVVTPLRDPSLLPQSVIEKAENQAERGGKAAEIGRKVSVFEEIK